MSAAHPLLPLTARTPRVLVLGQAATDPRFQLGGWSVEWQGVPEGVDVPAVTVLAGLRANPPLGVSVAYQDGSRPAEVQRAARDADVIVSVLGERPGAEGQADSPALALSAEDLARVKLLNGLGRPVVTVLLAGRPLDLRSVLPASDAFLMAYLPGSEGGRAVADALWGARNPSGRLPFTWPASPDALPSTLAAPSSTPPLFAFGSGLSYTRFEEAVSPDRCGGPPRQRHGQQRRPARRTAHRTRLRRHGRGAASGGGRHAAAGEGRNEDPGPHLDFGGKINRLPGGWAAMLKARSASPHPPPGGCPVG